MGLFNWFSKAKPKHTEEETLEAEPKIQLQPEKMPEEGGFHSVISYCEQMAAAKKHIEEIKIEYEAVTEYLTDIQKIEQVLEEEREAMEIAARNIGVYTKEREKCMDRNIKLTQEQRHVMDRHQGEISKDLKSIRDNEAYHGVIKSDIRHLEGEKGYLLYEQEEIIKKQKHLKNIAVTMAVLVISLFALILTLSLSFDSMMTIPFMLTIVMSACVAAYIFSEANKNRREMALINRKMAKAIGLLNKVKIKYVNNTSLLDYCYAKYEVNSADELEYIWKQYLLARDNEKKYKFNSERLAEARKLLVGELTRFGLKDPEIWVHQAEGIIDKRELVEVRHRLNVRRQKLRENLDYNTKAYNMSYENIQGYINNNPGSRSEVVSYMGNFGLTLQNT